MKIKLAKEIEFEGGKYAELTVDLDGLTGRDLVDAEAEASAIAARPVTDIDKTYQTCVAAKAATVPAELLFKLPARDFAKITSAVQNFLLGG